MFDWNPPSYCHGADHRVRLFTHWGIQGGVVDGLAGTLEPYEAALRLDHSGGGQIREFDKDGVLARLGWDDSKSTGVLLGHRNRWWQEVYRARGGR